MSDDEPDPIMYCPPPPGLDVASVPPDAPCAEGSQEIRLGWVDPKFLGSGQPGCGGLDCSRPCCDKSAREEEVMRIAMAQRKRMTQWADDIRSGGRRAGPAVEAVCRELRRAGAGVPLLAPFLHRGTAEATAAAVARCGLVETILHPLRVAVGLATRVGNEDWARGRFRLCLRALAALAATEEASSLHSSGAPQAAVLLLHDAAREGDTEGIRLCCQLLMSALLYDGDATVRMLLSSGVVEATTAAAGKLRGHWTPEGHVATSHRRTAVLLFLVCDRTGVPRDNTMLSLRFLCEPRSGWWPAPRLLPTLASVVGLCEALCRAAPPENGEEPGGLGTLPLLRIIAALFTHPHAAVASLALSAATAVSRRRGPAFAGTLASLRQLLSGGTFEQRMGNKRWDGVDPDRIELPQDDGEEAPSPSSLFIAAPDEDGGLDVGGVMLEACPTPGSITRTIAGHARKPVERVEYLGYGCVVLLPAPADDVLPVLLTTQQATALRRLCAIQGVPCVPSTCISAHACGVLSNLAVHCPDDASALAKEICDVLSSGTQEAKQEACCTVAALAECGGQPALRRLMDHGVAARVSALLVKTGDIDSPTAGVRRKASLAFKSCLSAADCYQMPAFAHRGSVRRLCGALLDGDGFNVRTLLVMLVQSGCKEAGLVEEARRCLPDGAVLGSLHPGSSAWLQEQAAELERLLRS